MQKILIYLIITLIIFLLFLGVKDYQMYRYSPYNIDISRNNELTINSNNIEANYNLEQLNLYLSDTLYKTEDFGETFIPKDTTNITDKSKIIKFEVEHDIIKNICREDKILGTVDYIDLMKYSKISDEINLIKYYIDNKNTKLSLFDFIYKYRTIYLASTFIDKLQLSGTITFLNGLNGIIMQNKDSTDVVLFNDGNMYRISFGSSYNQDVIIDILSTLKFI